MSTTTYPQSREEAGNHYWNVIKNIAAQYPDNPTRSDRLDTQNLIKSIIVKFTCRECIEHALEFMNSNPMNLDNRKSLMRWVCSLQNNANLHSNKPTIDCDDFANNSLGDGGCRSCTISHIKAPNIALATKVEPPKPTFTPDAQFESVWGWQSRYPSLKRNLALQSDNQKIEAAASIPTPGTMLAPPTDQNNMQSMSERYPSLAGFDDDFGVKKEEELDGILKPLDSIWAIPAGFVGIKPHEMNLAYTPEMTANTITLLMQMYLNNFGSLITTFGTSVLLFATSVLAKNNLGTYDKLFMQNVVASLLFHCLNFINPRIKDEVLPQGNKFIEGVMTMNFEKIKSSVLHGYQTQEELSNNELMALAKGQAGVIDMEKLKVPKMSYMGGQGHMFAGSTIRDMQNAGQSRYDTRFGGNMGGGSGLGGGKDDLSRVFNRGSTIRDYTLGVTNPQPNYGRLGQMSNEYDYILENNLL